MNIKLKKHLFRLLQALKPSPLAQTHAAEFVAACSGVTPRLLLREASALAKKEAASGEDVSIEDAIEDIGFLPPDRYFLRREDRRGWEERRESSIARLLRSRGLNNKPLDGQVSTVDRALLQTQTDNSVQYAGAQTAFPAGIHEHGALRFLVTQGIELIEPKQGNPEPFLSLLRGLCGVAIDPNGETQFGLMLGWLRHWMHALHNHDRHIPGQALGLGGSHGVGKNLIAGLISLLGGGRAVDPCRNFCGEDKFSGDLLGCTLAASHDPKFKDDEAARLFWQSHKTLVANREHSIRAMWADARTMPLAAVRGLVTFNLAPESSRILPPVLLESGTADKVILIRAYPPASPFPDQGTAEAEAWYGNIKASLPAVAWYLENEYVIPTHLADARFGVKGFCHPDIRSIIEGNHADSPLGELIDAWFGQAGHTETDLSGPVSMIYSLLGQTYEATLRSVSRSPVHMGHQLRRLRELDGWRERITTTDERIPPNNQRRTVWTIAAPGTPTQTG